jgi:hypothetical protein
MTIYKDKNELVQLWGDNSIIGRSCSVHANAAGNPGPSIACGKIVEVAHF